MTCNMAERLISAYIDHELSEDDRNRVRQHLAVCSSCMATYTATLKVKHALSSMAPTQCPQCVWENVERQIAVIPFQREAFQDSSPKPVWSFMKLVIPAAVAGTLIAIPLVQALLGVSLFGGAGNSQPPVVSNKQAPHMELSSPSVRVQTAGTSKSADTLDEILGENSWLLQPMQVSSGATNASQRSLDLHDLYEDHFLQITDPGWRYGR